MFFVRFLVLALLIYFFFSYGFNWFLITLLVQSFLLIHFPFLLKTYMFLVIKSFSGFYVFPLGSFFLPLSFIYFSYMGFDLFLINLLLHFFFIICSLFSLKTYPVLVIKSFFRILCFSFEFLVLTLLIYLFFFHIDFVDFL